MKKLLSSIFIRIGIISLLCFIINDNNFARGGGSIIISHPSNVEVCSGYSKPVSFVVKVDKLFTGTFQWQGYDRNNKIWVDITESSSFSGTETNTLTARPNLIGFKSGFKVRCKLQVKLTTEYSNSADLIILSDARITSDPVDQTVYEDQSVTFSVTASGSGSLKYQWQKDGSNISGATSSSHTINPVALGDAGNYRCKVSNTCGSDYSTYAALTVETLVTEDGWYSQNSTTTKNIYDVHFIDSNYGWAAVNNISDKLLHTSNGGNDWTSETTEIPTRFNSIHFYDEDTGWVTGSSYIGKTTDGGATWTSTSFSGIYFRSIYFIGSNGWAVGSHTEDGGKIFSTIDGGKNWVERTCPTDATLRSVYFVNESKGWAVGATGATQSTILYTDNGGVNWEHQTAPVNEDLYGVYFVDENVGWACGFSSTILRTTNGGADWFESNSNAFGRFYSIHFTDQNNGWVSGNNGKIYHTVDGGNSWHLQTTETTKYLYGLFMLDNETGWAVGQDGTIQATTTGGCFHPVADLGASQVLCENEDYLLIADTAEANENCTYLWDNGSTNDTKLVDSTDTYYVTVTSLCGEPAEGSVFIDFKSLPEAYAGEDISICDGDTIQLNATGGTTYKWSDHDASYLSNDTISNPLAFPANDRAFNVEVTNDWGCSASDQVTVDVHDIPTSTFTIANQGCVDETESIDYSGTATGSPNYSWVFDGGTVDYGSGEGPYGVNWGSTGAKEVSLAVEENNCYSDTTRHIINIYPIPYSAFDLADQVCGESNAIVTYLGVDSIGASFDWNFNGGSIMSGSGPGPYEINWTSGGNKEVSLTVTENGCTSPASSNQISVTYPYQNEQICIVTIDLETGKNMVVWEKTANKATDFYNVYRETNIAGSYVYIGSVDYNDTTLFVDILSEPEKQQHLYKITSVDTCGNESELANSDIHKTMLLQYAGSIGGINLSWSNKYEINSSPYDFSSYIIYRGSDSIALAPIDTISGSLFAYIDSDPIAQSGRMYYRVAGLSATACDPLTNLKASGGPFSQAVSNLEDNRLKEEVKTQALKADEISLLVYPNPYHEKVHINYRLTTESDVILSITNILGTPVATLANEKQASGSYNYSFDAGDYGFGAGVYFLEIRVDNKNLIRQIIELE